MSDEPDETESAAAPTDAAENAADEVASAEVVPEAAASIEEPAQIRASKSRSRLGSAISLGFSLAGKGFLAKASIGLAVLTTFGAIAVALLLARGDAPPLASVPGLTASALAWGGGFTFAVAAAARAFDRDATEGIRFLSRTRGVSLGTYAIGRVFGLALALILIVGVGSLVTGGVCATIASSSRGSIGRATLATAAYAIGFGVLMAPLAAATLGARGRTRGYVILIALLVVPEVLQDSIDSIPERWRSLFGIPSALDALRDSLTPARFDGPLAAAAALVILVTAAVAMMFAVEQALRATRTAEGR